ncbi:MAG: outer membrane protein transport protein [Nitrospirae bacterium]|nr:outer membrane protein transport protein [Nitrospirota bacterium]
MGGAFVSTADDTTAPIANPAGTAQLAKMQISLQYSYGTQNGNSGSYHYSGVGGPNDIVTVGQTTERGTSSKLSYGSFSTPIFNKALNIALFYSKTGDIVKNSTVSFHNSANGYAIWPIETKLSIDEYGLSLSKSFFDNKLMFGAGLSVFYMDLESAFYTSSAGGFATSSTQTYFLSNNNSSYGSGAKIGYRFGVLYKPLSWLNFGANGAIMPEYDYKTSYNITGFLNSLGNFGGAQVISYNFTNKLKVPDSYSFGVSVRPIQNLLISTEAKYVLYSQLMRDFYVAYDTYTGSTSNPTATYSASDFKINDIVEYHLGTEYMFNITKELPLAVRLGTYYVPKHSLECTINQNMRDLGFDGGKNLWHVTGGIGTVIANHLQLDLAGDFSDANKKFIASTVYQF